MNRAGIAKDATLYTKIDGFRGFCKQCERRQYRVYGKRAMRRKNAKDTISPKKEVLFL